MLTVGCACSVPVGLSMLTPALVTVSLPFSSISASFTVSSSGSVASSVIWSLPSCVSSTLSSAEMVSAPLLFIWSPINPVSASSSVIDHSSSSLPNMPMASSPVSVLPPPPPPISLALVSSGDISSGLGSSVMLLGVGSISS